MTAATQGGHMRHMLNDYYLPSCDECEKDLTAIDWLLAVRKFGLDVANAMFPASESDSSPDGRPAAGGKQKEGNNDE